MLPLLVLLLTTALSRGLLQTSLIYSHHTAMTIITLLPAYKEATSGFPPFYSGSLEEPSRTRSLGIPRKTVKSLALPPYTLDSIVLWANPPPHLPPAAVLQPVEHSTARRLSLCSALLCCSVVPLLLTSATADCLCCCFRRHASPQRLSSLLLCYEAALELLRRARRPDTSTVIVVPVCPPKTQSPAIHHQESWRETQRARKSRRLSCAAAAPEATV